MSVFLTTEQAIEYIETMWGMNDLNIKLALVNDVMIDQEELWAHEALQLVLLQAKSNNYLESFAVKGEDKEEKSE